MVLGSRCNSERNPWNRGAQVGKWLRELVDRRSYRQLTLRRQFRYRTVCGPVSGPELHG